MRAACVYRIYADDDALLYVGLSTNPLARVMQHSGEKDWWADVSRIAVEHFASLEQATQAETDAIKAEAPMHNIRSGGVTDPEVLAARRARREEASRASLERLERFFHPDGRVLCGECGHRPVRLPKREKVIGGVCPRCENAALALDDEAAA